MGAALKLQKEGWVNRSPRYVVNTGEQKVLRFSRGGSRKKIAKTRILNISDTGMAFWVDGRAIPHIGEIIKVEFEVDGRVTRYGRVVRLESPSELTSINDIQVAIEFLTEKAVEDEGLGLVLSGSFSAIENNPAKPMHFKEIMLAGAGILAAAGLIFVLI